jgi:hypothetical protein
MKIIEIHLAEITLNQGKIIPVFGVPEKQNEPVEESTGSADVVRSLPTVAPRLGLEPRTCRLTAGCSAN